MAHFVKPHILDGGVATVSHFSAVLSGLLPGHSGRVETATEPCPGPQHAGQGPGRARGGSWHPTTLALLGSEADVSLLGALHAAAPGSPPEPQRPARSLPAFGPCASLGQHLSQPSAQSTRGLSCGSARAPRAVVVGGQTVRGRAVLRPPRRRGQALTPGPRPQSDAGGRGDHIQQCLPFQDRPHQQEAPDVALLGLL